MALTVHDILMDADLFRAAYPAWPSVAQDPGDEQQPWTPGAWPVGMPLIGRELTGYPEALDEPRPEGTPSRTARRMASLLRADCKEG
jgi:hypothetical protein